MLIQPFYLKKNKLNVKAVLILAHMKNFLETKQIEISIQHIYILISNRFCFNQVKRFSFKLLRFKV